MSQVIDRRRRGFFMVDNAVVSQYGPEVGAIGVAIYNVLAMHGNRAFPGQQRIADMLGVSRATVNTYLQKLEDVGLVLSEQRHRDDGGMSTKVYVLPPVNDVDTPCQTGLQQNNTQSNKIHTTYEAQASGSVKGACTSQEWVPDEDTKWYTPYVRQVREHWQTVSTLALRDRCIDVTRFAVSLRSPNDKGVPPAIATALTLVYREVFGQRVPPDPTRLMNSQRRKGGPERLAAIMVEVGSREVVGDPHDLIDRWGSYRRRDEPNVDAAVSATWGRVIE